MKIKFFPALLALSLIPVTAPAQTNPYVGYWTLISENGMPQEGFEKSYDSNGTFSLSQVVNAHEEHGSMVVFYNSIQSGTWNDSNGIITEVCDQGNKGTVNIACRFSGDTLVQTFAYAYAPDLEYVQEYLKQPTSIVSSADIAVQLYHPIVLSGATPTAELLAEDDWIYPDFISSSNKADSELNILYYYPDAVSTCQKSTIFKLFPNVKHFVIDGRPANKEQVEAIPISYILGAELQGDTLQVSTTRNSTENQLYTTTNQDCWTWYNKQFENCRTNILANNLGRAVLTDLSTYGNQFITVGVYLHTPAQAAKLVKDKDLTIRILGAGELLRVLANCKWYGTDPYEFAIKEVRLQADNVQGKTINEIIALSGIPSEEVNEIIYDGKQVIIVSFPPKYVEP